MNSKVLLSFTTVVLIWSTTPLAIQWSTLGSSPYFAVAARMAIGLGICLLLLRLKRQKLNTQPIALKNYAYAGLGIFITMSLIYFSAQHISSGIISVVFGLTPILTGVFAYFLLKESFFKLHKIIGLLLGLGGLVLVFHQTFFASTYLIVSLLTITIGMSFQAFISVKLKQINARISALETTTGALIFSTPLFIISALLMDERLPIVTLKAALSIGYLALFGSVIGFNAYYYLIRHANVRVVGIVPLITPVFALLLGNQFNSETLTLIQLIGITTVLLGLAYYEYGAKFWQKELTN